MRTPFFALSLLLVAPATALADVGDERLVFGLGASGCAGISNWYELGRLAQNADGTNGGFVAWSVPVGAILEITDVEFEAPYHLDPFTKYFELYVVNRWTPNLRYLAWRQAYGSIPLGSVNSTTFVMTASTLYETRVRQSFQTHFGSGILVNAAGKACLALGLPVNSFESPLQLRIRGRLHPDDDLLFPPVVGFSP